LVGAANRADIRRLARLEAENAELLGQLERQQERLQQVTAARDEAIDRLSREIERSRDVEPSPRAREAPKGDQSETRAAREENEALDRKLGLESARRERADRRADAAEDELARLQTGFAAMRQELASVKQELESLDARVAATGNLEDTVDLTGAALA